MAMDNIAYYSSLKLLEEGSAMAVNPSRDYGDMPLVVLTAGEDGATPELPSDLRAELAIQLAWKKRDHAKLAALSTAGAHLVVEGSSHDIPHLKPQAVIDAIVEVVDTARASHR